VDPGSAGSAAPPRGRRFRGCPAPSAEWFPWHGRDLGSAVKVFGHCDGAPWNIVARLEHLPPLTDRARQLAAIVDGYGLTARQRRGFLNQIIEFAICDTAWEADDAAVTPETTAHPVAPWAMAWRARSAAWMIRHRRTLETALTRGAS
jgi:hypothetical protein